MNLFTANIKRYVFLTNEELIKEYYLYFVLHGVNRSMSCESIVQGDHLCLNNKVC